MPYSEPYVGPQFISSQSMTVANLIANYPASVDTVGKYAKVSDLWGNVEEIMRCCYDGNTYYWRPQRTDYAVNSSVTSGTVNLVPLLSAPQIYMTQTLLGNVTVTPSTTNVWPGCRFEVVAPSNLGLYTLSFSGLIGGLVGNLLASGSRVLEYTSAGWKSK